MQSPPSKHLWVKPQPKWSESSWVYFCRPRKRAISRSTSTSHGSQFSWCLISGPPRFRPIKTHRPRSWLVRFPTHGGMGFKYLHGKTDFWWIFWGPWSYREPIPQKVPENQVPREVAQSKCLQKFAPLKKSRPEVALKQFFQQFPKNRLRHEVT